MSEVSLVKNLGRDVEGIGWRRSKLQGVTGVTEGLVEPVLSVARIISSREVAVLVTPRGRSPCLVSIEVKARLGWRDWSGIQTRVGRYEGQRAVYFRLNPNQ